MRGVLTFERLKRASFTHSAIYLGLIVTIFTGPDDLKTVLGWSHGIGWIVMSLACIAALRLRVIDLRLAVAVAVLGGVGPFVGSIEFARQSRRGRGAPGPAVAETHLPRDDGAQYGPAPPRRYSEDPYDGSTSCSCRYSR